MAEALIDTSFESMGNYALPQIPKAVFTPTMHSRALRLKLRMQSQSEISADIRVLISAAILTYDEVRSARASIAKTLQASLAAQYDIFSPNALKQAAHSRGRAFFSNQAIVEALILREALTRRTPPFRRF